MAAAQSVIDSYIGTRDGMDGIFVADANTLIYCHTNRAAIGSPTLTDESDLTYTASEVEAAKNNVFLKGVVKSSSSDQMVAAVYAGVYNSSGKLLGYVGGGCSISDLQNTVYSMDLNGYEETQIYLINVTRSSYTFSPDEEEQGTEIASDFRFIYRSPDCQPSGCSDPYKVYFKGSSDHHRSYSGAWYS